MENKLSILEQLLIDYEAALRPSDISAAYVAIESYISQREHTAREEGFEAAKEQETYNVHDPSGRRAEAEAGLPIAMRTIGFAAGCRNKYPTFSDYCAQRNSREADDEASLKRAGEDGKT